MFYFNTDNQNTSFIRNLQVISGEGGTPHPIHAWGPSPTYFKLTFLANKKETYLVFESFLFEKRFLLTWL